MQKAVYFVLILCGILSQGICNVYKENSVAADESSDLLIRQKRIVGSSSFDSDTHPFLVHVMESGNYHCPASLLTADVAISSASCFINLNHYDMRIMSRLTVGTSAFHVIVQVIFLDPNFNPAYPTVRNLALVRFTQSINFRRSFNRPTTIYRGNLVTEQMMIHAVNWGRPTPTLSGRVIPSSNCQAIGVQVININYCQNVYPNIIGYGNICAVPLQPGEHCEITDSGAPLVVNSELLGIFVYRGHSHISHPEVFMNLLDNGIRRWIHEHVPSLGLF